MELIPKDSYRGWASHSGSWRTPKAISSFCPYCGAKVTFTLGLHTDDSHRNTISSSSNCPDCNKPVRFWTLRDPSHKIDQSKNPEHVYMHPGLDNIYRKPAFAPNVPVPLQRSFIATVDSFNSKNFNATAVSARRTLEGIFKHLVSAEQRNQNLAKLITLVSQDTNFAKPLNDLSHAVREGGNIGAHFDMENEPDEVLARQMVELVDYLISFLYVLPGKIQQLESSLDKAPPIEPAAP